MYDSTKTKCIGFLKRLHDTVLQCKVPGHQRTLQAGRKLRMSLDQPLDKAGSGMWSDQNAQGWDQMGF